MHRLVNECKNADTKNDSFSNQVFAPKINTLYGILIDMCLFVLSNMQLVINLGFKFWVLERLINLKK